MTRKFTFFLLFLISIVFWTFSAVAFSPPSQPTSGPGSNIYTHNSYIKSKHGSGDLKYVLYEPDSPKPDNAPLLLYVHGWGADNTKYYDKMLTHFARKGYIVVFPKFNGTLDINDYENHAKTIFENALIELRNSDRVAPDLDKVIFSGHSLGTQVMLRMAETADSRNYPAPKGIILHEAAGAIAMEAFPLDDLGNIDNDTLMVVIARDDWDKDEGTYPIPVSAWHGTEHLKNRNFIVVKSDNSGKPQLRSTHNSVQTGTPLFWEKRKVDAIDWYGYWRTTEAAINFALYGKDREYILGTGADVTYMGKWNNGKVVKPKEIVSDDVLDRMYQELSN